MYSVNVCLPVPATCQARTCTFEAVLGDKERDRDLKAPAPHQSCFRRMRGLSEGSANTKCNLKTGEPQGTQTGRMPGSPHPGPPSACPQAKEAAGTVSQGPHSTLLCCSLSLVCMHAFVGVCMARVCTCDEQEPLTSAPGVFQGPLKLRV